MKIDDPPQIEKTRPTGKKKKNVYIFINFFFFFFFFFFFSENGFNSDNFNQLEFLPQLISKLNQVEWRRVDLSFGGSKTNLLSKSIHEQFINPVKSFSTPSINPEATLVFFNFLASILLKDLKY